MKNLDGKTLTSEELEAIKRKNDELLKEAESGNFTALLNAEFIFSDEVYNKVFTD